jgi:hypothetical protein
VREASKRSAQELIDLWQAQDGAAAHEAHLPLISCGAKARHTVANIRAGRRVGKTFGTVSLHTLASTVERGAWRNVDPAITATFSAQ